MDRAVKSRQIRIPGEAALTSETLLERLECNLKGNGQARDHYRTDKLFGRQGAAPSLRAPDHMHTQPDGRPPQPYCGKPSVRQLDGPRTMQHARLDEATDRNE